MSAQTLRCKLCGETVPMAPVHVCEYCFGPLEIALDKEAIIGKVTRELIESRPKNLWRYRELLPLNEAPKVGLDVGYTPLVAAPRLADALGLDELYIKNDSV